MSNTAYQDIYGFYTKSTIPEYFHVTQSAAPTTYLPHVLPDDALPLFKHPQIGADSQIRFISLLPPEGPSGSEQSKEPIQCRIEVYRLPEAPEYEALSYTWGQMDRHLPVSILGTDINGNETEEALLATPQLLMALRRLRLPSTPRLLWIDQLCIDQENMEERGSQVQLMGSIYKSASRTIIYLGEDVTRLASSSTKTLYEADSNHLLDLVTGLSSTSQIADIVGPVTSLIDFRPTFFFENVKMRRLRAVYELLSRPWFQRAWVFQEASLAKRLCVQFGSAEMDFDDLENVCHAINRAQVELGLHQEFWMGNLGTSTPGYEMMKLIKRTRRGSASQPRDQSFLCKLLQVLRRVECGDQRDRIFAFLAFQEDEGIISSGSAYQDPVSDVWRMAAQRIIKASRSLDIFAALSGGTGSVLETQSSWVPDWANCFPFGRPIATPLSRFNACRSIAHECCQAENPRQLRARGKIIDTIKRVYPLFLATNPLKGRSVSSFLSWECILKDANGHLYTPDIWKRLGNYVDIKKSNMERDLMRTLIADGALGSDRVRRIDKFVLAMKRGDDIRQWRLDRASLTDEQRRLVSDYERLEDLVLIAQHKNIFFTENLQLGLAGKVAKEGDVVAILHGSKAPIILRKRDHDDEYQAICQCYLDGWMYGESPREVFGNTEKDPLKSPHPHGRWWNENPDDFTLV
ncbi:heterokaryon incompatibility protein-domain-containing protein [Dactylonectria estremocensis]|uniref:Heterokaryon incompatibility protein-domain-containing protein n=1 Tax=Dactylonectria estremocensis TaxID=1079267 RepID=A0A9P9F3R7_9HYPO|nr:heterokaryon incompatibility protein-domain-containing protein [Dactylonectria estremocensis]